MNLRERYFEHPHHWDLVLSLPCRLIESIPPREPRHLIANSNHLDQNMAKRLPTMKRTSEESAVHWSFAIERVANKPFQSQPCNTVPWPCKRRHCCTGGRVAKALARPTQSFSKKGSSPPTSTVVVFGQMTREARRIDIESGITHTKQQNSKQQEELPNRFL